MKKTTDSLIREMHSDIAVVKSEISNLRNEQSNQGNKLEHIQELVLNQNSKVDRNAEEISEHLKEHRRKEKNNMWKAGVVIGLATFTISLIVRLLLP